MYIHFVFPFHIGLYNFIILFLGDWLDIVAAGRRLRSLRSLRCSLQCIFLLQRSKISLFTPTMKIPPNLTTDWFHYVSKYTLFTLRYYLLHQLSHITNTHISTRTSIYTRFFFSSSYFFRFSLSAKFCCFIQSFFVFGSNFHSVCVCIWIIYHNSTLPSWFLSLKYIYHHHDSFRGFSLFLKNFAYESIRKSCYYFCCCCSTLFFMLYNGIFRLS